MAGSGGAGRLPIAPELAIASKEVDSRGLVSEQVDGEKRAARARDMKSRP
jgi:hypothetical protein